MPVTRFDQLWASFSIIGILSGEILAHHQELCRLLAKPHNVLCASGPHAFERAIDPKIVLVATQN